MKRVLLIITVVMLTSIFGSAFDGEKSNTHHRPSITGMLTSSDCWQLEMSYHYMFCKYIGAGGGIGILKNYFVEGYASGRDWNIDSDDEKPQHVYIHPSIVLKSPSVSIRQTHWGLYAEPGAMLTLPYTRVAIRNYKHWPSWELAHASTKHGQWFGADLRVGLYFEIGPASISFGYIWSNYDIYSQYRHLSYRGTSFSQFYPSKPVTHGAFLSFSANI